MKKIVIAVLGIFLVCAMGCADSRKKNPVKGYIFTDNVKVLAKANEQSDVLGTLNVHDIVKILNEVNTERRYGFLPWRERYYEISFNDTKAYILANYADTEKYLFNIKEKTIIVYPRLASGWHWCSRPDCGVVHFPEYSVFINDRKVEIPDGGSWLEKCEVIDNDLHLIYRSYGNGDRRAVISAEGDEMFIRTKDHNVYIKDAESVYDEFSCAVIYQKSLKILKYRGNNTMVSIPASLDALPVTEIANMAFSDSSMSSITIPSSVTSIGNCAFWNCKNLTSVDIPSSVTSIGIQAFEGCGSLTRVTIPSSVTHIGSYAFGGCNRLISVVIPPSVTSIEDAFVGCTSLTSVTLSRQTTVNVPFGPNVRIRYSD